MYINLLCIHFPYYKKELSLLVKSKNKKLFYQKSLTSLSAFLYMYCTSSSLGGKVKTRAAPEWSRIIRHQWSCKNSWYRPLRLTQPYLCCRRVVVGSSSSCCNYLCALLCQMCACSDALHLLDNRLKYK